ncbi:hypothetical protein Cni_G10754 [Canna indica]|uniref:Uncharacterized protein n=1 Tax=Canna indica TaxID=4628 RepID=A0AAQ3K510_9LILI|nr:hypothetical protein Cni_G10754 [Canna indica]
MENATRNVRAHYSFFCNQQATAGLAPSFPLFLSREVISPLSPQSTGSTDALCCLYSMSMAKEDFCLPSEFLCDDFFLSHEDEDRRDEAGFTEACFADEFAMNFCFLREMEEEETYVAGLTRQMADRYVLHHGGRPPLAAFSATSPDLTRQQLMQSAQVGRPRSNPRVSNH